VREQLAQPVFSCIYRTLEHCRHASRGGGVRARKVPHNISRFASQPGRAWQSSPLTHCYWRQFKRRDRADHLPCLSHWLTGEWFNLHVVQWDTKITKAN
jgi:hypothetical protein